MSLDAIYLGTQEVSYTSKKTNKLVEFKELQFVLNGAVSKWAFQNVAKDFPYSKLSQFKTGEPVELVVKIEASGFDNDKPKVVLVDVNAV